MRGMLDGVGGAVGHDDHLVWVPTAFLQAQNVSPWSDLPVWIPGQGDTAGFARRNIGKALAAGLTFRPLGLTATETLAWFRTLPAERQVNLKAGLAPAREAELLVAWKAKA
jgi:2'-hydroxyisoflavone reductase